MAKRKARKTAKRKTRKAAPRKTAKRKARKAAPRKAAKRKTAKRKAVKRTTPRRIGAVKTKRKPRPAKVGKPRKTMAKGSRKNKLTTTLLHGGSAFAGGYVAPMVRDVLPVPAEYGTYVPAVLGLLLTFVQPTGVVGAAGLGMIGASGAEMSQGDKSFGKSRIRGARSEQARMIREELRRRSGMRGVPRDRMVITGVPGDDTVLTGTDNVTASTYDRVRGTY